MGRAEFTLGIALVMLSLSVIAQEHKIEIEGVQSSPNIYGRYIVYLQDIGNGKNDIHVYDSGKTVDPLDDVGVIKRITEDGASHNYDEPVIDGRYIAWLDDWEKNGQTGTDVYVYDMGEDMRIGQGEAYIKLNTFNGIKGRNYIQKEDLHISDGILVWEDFDQYSNGGGDSDIRGYDLNVPGDATDDENDPHHLIISDEKEQTLNKVTERIDESDPFILGEEVVFASIHLQPFEETAEINQEIYKKDLSTGRKTLVSDPESECIIASMPSIDRSGSVTWADHCPPNNVIIHKSTFEEKLVQSLDRIFYYPQNNFYLSYIYEKDYSYFFSIEKSQDKANLNSYHFDSDEYRAVYSDGDLNEASPPDHLEPRESFWEEPRIAQLEDGNFAVAGSNVLGIDVKISNGNDEVPYVNIPTGRGKYSIVPGDSGGAIIFYCTESKLKAFARSLSADNTLGEEILIRSFDNIESYYDWCHEADDDHYYIPDHSGGAYMVWSEEENMKTYAQLLHKDGAMSPIVPIAEEEFERYPAFLVLEDGTLLCAFKKKPSDEIRFVFIKGEDVRSFDHMTWFPNRVTITLLPDNGGATAFIRDESQFDESIILSVSKEGVNREFEMDSQWITSVTKSPSGYYLTYYSFSDTGYSFYLTHLKDWEFSEPILLLDNLEFIDIMFYRTDSLLGVDGNLWIILTESGDYTDLMEWDGQNLGKYRFERQYITSVLNSMGELFFLFYPYQISQEWQLYKFVYPPRIFPRFEVFLRGDTNNDGIRNIADAINILGYLFKQGDAKPKVSCLDTLDANDDAIINIADAVKLLGHLFSGTGPLPEPFDAVGEDPTGDEIGCECYGTC